MLQKEPLFGKTLAELQDVCAKLEWPKFRAKQIADWLYKKKITAISEMTNLSKEQRNLLEKNFILGLQSPVDEQISADGTKKYLFPTFVAENTIEAVYIPDRKRHTLCISSQCGCKRQCVFCMTGKQGLQANLSANEILNQIRSVPGSELLTNIVFMGMGEPFDNIEAVLKSLEILTGEWGFAMSPRRITVSTIGILPKMKDFLEKSNCHLAVSLHSPFDEEREQLIPAQSKHPIREIIETLKNHPFENQRRLSFEYILFAGFNDSKRHTDELSDLLRGLKCRVNLIRFHELPDIDLKTSDRKTIEGFNTELNRKGIITTTRRSRGMDIFAACGMLSSMKR